MALSKQWKRYTDFVKENPALLRRIESGISWLPALGIRFTPGREKWSNVSIEALEMISPLVALANDIILRREHALPISSSQVITTLKIIYQCLVYTELFFERISLLFQGEHIRWSVISIIQLMKTVIRMVLLFGFKQGMFITPVVPTLNREKDLLYALKLRQKRHEQRAQRTFLLKSGREVQTLEATPPLSKRRWCETQSNKVDPMIHMEEKFSFNPSQLTEKQIIGEVLHMMTPIAHLISMRIFGKKSWTPWMIALGMDVISIQQQQSPKLQHAEQVELSKRKTCLGGYLLKAPLYENHVKERIHALMSNLSSNLPLVGYFEPDFKHYLNDIGETYFRTWS